MKIGVRKPSIKKSIKARTTGKIKRSVKKTVNPLYSKNGIGLVTNPKKAVYNKVYNKTTVGVRDFVPNSNTSQTITETSTPGNRSSNTMSKILGIISLIFGTLFMLIGLLSFAVGGFIFIIPSIVLIIVGRSCLKSSKTKKEVEEL